MVSINLISFSLFGLCALVFIYVFRRERENGMGKSERGGNEERKKIFVLNF